MIRHLLLGLVAACTLTATAHAREVSADQIRERVERVGVPVIVAHTADTGSVDVETHASSSGTTTVLIDGVLVEMDDEMLRALIRSGILKVEGDGPVWIGDEPVWPPRDDDDDDRFPGR